MKRIIVVLMPLMLITTPLLASEAQLRKQLMDLQEENRQIKKIQKEYGDILEKIQDEDAVSQDLVMDMDKQIQSKLKLSGYADIEFNHSSRDGANDGFRLHHFALFVSKNISDRWRLFSEVEYEDAPSVEYENNTCTDCSGKIVLEAMNVDYVYRPYLNLRAGRFYTPAGIWSTSYYPPFVPTQERPAHIRKIFPQLVDGAMIYGNPKFYKGFLGYYVYLGNGEGNSGATDNNSSRAVGMRLSAIYDDWELGTSFYRDRLGNPGTDEGTVKTAVGAHAKLKFYGLTFQSEYAYGKYERTTGAEYDKDGYYAQLYYTKNQYLIGYRYDRFVDYDPSAAIQREKQLNHSAFVNYRVKKDLVLKLEHHLIDSNVTADYNSTILSLVVFLGE